MTAQAGGELRTELRSAAAERLAELAPAEREALLIQGWMSHDARWFAAAAGELGMDVANRLNQTAANEVGRAEARRIARALDLPAPSTVREVLLAQETLIGLLGPDLMGYELAEEEPDSFTVHVSSCFAYEQVRKAGMLEAYSCGIFSRIGGWLDAFDISYEISPPLGKCQKAQGGECAYTFHLQFGEASEDMGRRDEVEHAGQATPGGSS